MGNAVANRIASAFLSQKDAAALLGVSVTFLTRSDAPRYQVPSTEPNGRPLLRYDREELVAWMKQYLVGR